jgi:hypothetical protein
MTNIDILGHTQTYCFISNNISNPTMRTGLDFKYNFYLKLPSSINFQLLKTVDNQFDECGVNFSNSLIIHEEFSQ